MLLCIALVLGIILGFIYFFLGVVHSSSVVRNEIFGPRRNEGLFFFFERRRNEGLN